MDTKKLISEAKAKFSHQESKLYLQEKYTSKLHFASQNGMWTATPELINFLKNFDNLIILDNFKNPIKVNAVELYNTALTHYNNVMYEWHNEYEELKKLR